MSGHIVLKCKLDNREKTWQHVRGFTTAYVDVEPLIMKINESEPIRELIRASYLPSFSPHVLLQPVQRATSCAPQACVWRRVAAVTVWTTARTRATRSSAVGPLLAGYAMLLVQQV